MAEANLKTTIKNRQKPFVCCKENYKISNRIIAAGNKKMIMRVYDHVTEKREMYAAEKLNKLFR